MCPGAGLWLPLTVGQLGRKKHCRTCYSVILIAAALYCAAFKQTSHLDVDGECLVAFKEPVVINFAQGQFHHC